MSLAHHARQLRLGMELTQKELAERSGVALSSLRLFEQKGEISLASYVKLQLVLGNLEKIIAASKPQAEQFASLDAVLKADEIKARKRGKRSCA